MGAHASCCAAGSGKSLPPGWARGFTTDEANGEEAAKVDNSDVIAQESVLKVEPDVAPTAGEEPSSPPTKDLEEPTAEAPETTEQKAEQKSLFDRIGGEAAVDAAVEQFYEKLLADESLAPAFASSDMANLKGMQKKFLTLAFGGPSEYSGKSMKDAHQDKGITNDQFGAVAGHLSATLTQLGVPGPEHDEVMAIAASTQGDIVKAPLYDRLGGEAAVDAAVEQFYAKLLADESLAPAFASSDMANLKAMQKKFLTLAFGGPSDYSGKSMKDAHQGKGITGDQFGAVAGHLSATLTQLGVPGPEHDEVMAIAASTQGDIVEEPVKEAAKEETAAKADPGKADEKPKTSKTTSATKTKAKSKAKSKAPDPAKKEEPKKEEVKKEEVKKEEPKKEDAGPDLDALWKAMSKEEQEEKGEKLRDNAGKGGFTAVTALLEAGVSTEAKHKDGFTALHYAAENGHMEVVEVLLKYKADCTATLVRGEWGMTPLHFAARKGHKDVTKLLVKKGKKALKMKNYKGKTPTEIATGAAMEYLEDL